MKPTGPLWSCGFSFFLHKSNLLVIYISISESVEKDRGDLWMLMILYIGGGVL